MLSDESRLAYLARIASLYYDYRKSQQEIADEVRVSRSAVSRLLSEARERGIVEIKVHHPWQTAPSLERSLVSSFSLRAALVLQRENKTYAEMLRGIGALAANYLHGVLRNGMVIGISWGTALYETILAVNSLHLPDAEVVQMIGAVGSADILTDGPVLGRLLADRLDARLHPLHAPLTVESEAGRAALLCERHVREALERSAHADMALVGIGSMVPELYSLRRAGYVTEQEADQLRAAGAVGDICGQHFSLSGQWLDTEVNRRVVGISLQALSGIGMVVGIAGGRRKAPAILGALSGGYLDVLVTDDHAAREILALQAAAA